MSDSTADQDLLFDALLASGDVAYVWDIVSDRMVFIGDGAEALLGSDRIANGAAFQTHINAEDLPRRQAAMDDHLAGGGRFDCEYRLRRPDGSFCWVHDRGRVETETDGRPRRMAGTLRTVTGRKAAEERQRERAVYDALTGHYNQSRLRDALEHALSHAHRYGTEGGYLVVGIDNMAGMAAAYGEAVTDAICLAVGQRLEECVRTADLIGRLDAHRFGVVLSHCTPTGLAAAAEKIVAAVSDEPVTTAAGALAIDVSVGGVLFPTVAATATGAMVSGDDALDKAHRTTPGYFVRSQAGPAGSADEQTGIGDTLLAALQDGRVAFAYQPVVRGGNGEVAYYETLLRILDGENDPVPASVFVPVAERLGYSPRIDRYVLDLAVAELEAHPGLRLAINISGLTVTDRAWLRRLSGLVGGQPEIAERLIVEITETAALYDFEESLRFVSAVRALGCPVSLDDFGAGHTTFRHLRTFPVDTVKIDGSYVRGVAHNPANQKFIDTLLGMAESFGMEIVAEGVESQADLNFLLDRGVTYLQGWQLGVPMLARPTLSDAVN